LQNFVVENGAYSTSALPVNTGNPFINSSPLFISGRLLKVFFSLYLVGILLIAFSFLESNACYHSVQNLFSSSLLSKNI